MRPFWLCVTLAIACLAGAPGPACALVTPPFEIANPSGGERPTAVDAAAAPDGSVLFVWNTQRPDFTGSSINAWRFSDHGVPYGSPLAILLSATSSNTRAAPNPAGGFFLATTPGSAFGDGAVVLRRLDAAAAPLPGTTRLDAAVERGPHGVSIAATPSGAVASWWEDATVRSRRVGTLGEVLAPAVDVVTEGVLQTETASTGDGGFLVSWEQGARAFDADGTPRGPALDFGDYMLVLGTAPLADGGWLVAGNRYLVRLPDRLEQQIQLFRLTPDAQLASTTLVATLPLTIDAFYFGGGDVAVDFEGNAAVVWSEYQHLEGNLLPPLGLKMQGFDAAGAPVGGPVVVSRSGGVTPVRLQTLPDGRFVGVWMEGTHVKAAFTSVCTPSSTVCGNGAIYERCEECDDGPANSDTLPDACRTDCRRAHCGDGVVDTGEACDDGNLLACDGCSADCTVEPGPICGDGTLMRSCGEQCDDGNATGGDGCAADCIAERIPGGGSPATDCAVEWVVRNPTNVPPLDRKGQWSGIQVCTDDDPRCDFDGGVPGGCTFGVRICANNTNLPDCDAERRIGGWTLVKPSAKEALRKPAAATVRAAFTGVVGQIVGPTTPDLCTNELLVRAPLRGVPGLYRKAKTVLRAEAPLYSGATDKDKLRLICLPR